MKVRVPLMVQDPMTARYKGIAEVEHSYITEEDFFLDGPVTERVAVLDFDPGTGALSPGARFLPPGPGKTLGRYDVPDTVQTDPPGFIQVNAFATVLKTIYMVENALGRRVTWAFDGPQLFVVPRAGDDANAYYERDSHSLQFFCFDHPDYPGDKARRVHTCLSRDVVAHETGHAILDGIAPDLYDAVTPQSLAFHEALADLTALFMAFRSPKLTDAVLGATGGSIADSNAFSAVAEEFGTALEPAAHVGYLRNLKNDKTLKRGGAARAEPHELSEVLSGALYAVMIKLHEKLKREYDDGDAAALFSASGRALAVGGDQLLRMLFRAVDYLPPGEVSFADFGRAIIADDQAHYPATGDVRKWIKEEFVKRRMVLNAGALQVKTNYRSRALDDVDLETLVESDWAAYDFANRNGRLLGIPADKPFEVRPRLKVDKVYYTGGHKKVSECLFKVSWTNVEPNGLGSRFPSRRRVTVGTTLAIDWDTKLVRARLTSDRRGRPEEEKEQRRDRHAMLCGLVEADLLKLDEDALGPDGRPLRAAVRAESTQDAIRVRGTARTLHIVRGL